MNPFNWISGFAVVARHEVAWYLRSTRLLIMTLLTALVIIGGSFGFGALGAGGPFRVPPIVAWTHPVYGANGDHVATVWVSDPFGNPLANRPVRFLALNESTGEQVLLATKSTSTEGFANLSVGGTANVIIQASSGTVEVGANVAFVPRPSRNFTVAQLLADLEGDGLRNDLGLHVLDLNGVPPVGRVLVNGTPVGALNRLGYIGVHLRAGWSNITIEVNSESFSYIVTASSDREFPFTSGPDLVLLTVSGPASLIISLSAMVIGFDAIAKERGPGTLDLLLSRPVGRTALILGKFLAAFAAVALPVTIVSLVGIASIAQVSGRPPDGGLSFAFLGLGLLLIGTYVLLQFVVSTVSKTSGKAILYSVFIWILLAFLYDVIVFLLSLAILPGNPQAQFWLLQAADLGSPNALYARILSSAAPESIQAAGRTTSIDAPVLLASALIWLVLLLATALGAFRREPK